MLICCLPFLQSILCYLNLCICCCMLHICCLWTKHVIISVVLPAVFRANFASFIHTVYRTSSPSFPHLYLSPNIFCDLALSEQTVEILIIFQLHKANLIHLDYSALKCIDLSPVKCLNIVNETERNFITSPPCVHVFVRCYINNVRKGAQTHTFLITQYPWQCQV